MRNKNSEFRSSLLGKEHSFEKLISSKTIESFAEFSGDYNPIHFVQASGDAPIAHGMIAGALFSRLIGMQLPGPGSLYLTQNMMFKKPILPPVKIIVSGKVVQVTNSTKTLRLETMIKNKKNGEILVTGEAMVKVP